MDQKNELAHKLDVLCQIAAALNGRQITWAVGASVLLYFKGIVEDFHDLDLLVAAEDFHRAAELLQNLGQLQVTPPNSQYESKFFHEFLVDGVEVDIMGGCTVRRNGRETECFVLKNEDIQGCVDLKGQQIPLHSVPVWRGYYEAMGRDSKVALIDGLKI